MPPEHDPEPTNLAEHISSELIPRDTIQDTVVALEPQDIQPEPVPSPKDKPTNFPNISNLSKDDYNRTLQETLAYFKHKPVKIPDGRVGTVVGVDPRPMKGVPTSSGNDGNYLVVQVRKVATRPGRTPMENVWFMPDDLTVVDTLKGKEIKT